jgi:HlyD family secretion protein
MEGIIVSQKHTYTAVLDPVSVPGLPPLSGRQQGVRNRVQSKVLLAGVLVIIAAAALAVWHSRSGTDTPSWGSAQISRGDIAKTISATGKVQAVTTVQVGSQVSGTVSEIYVDYNSEVKKGQVIARLDPSQLQAQLTQASANQMSSVANIQSAQNAVLSADAAVQAAEANEERTRSVLADAERSAGLTEQLVNEGVAARRDLETAKAQVAQAAAQRQQALAQVNQAKAQAQSARSQLNQARAQAQQAAAAVQVASVNLESSIIKAPIDGVVVARSVEPGQTVAASFQAPTLFLIANDLKRMQVLADIDEADIGQLGPDSRATFTVDAYPADVFHGRISQIRLAPQNLQNVVTYTAVIDVENPDLKLKPGMTANLTAVVAHREGVLRVPNAALRFRPENASDIPAAAQIKGAVVWRVENNQLQPVAVKTGITDGITTEVVAGILREGDTVAVAAQSSGAAARPARNPMMPGGRGRR